MKMLNMKMLDSFTQVSEWMSGKNKIKDSMTVGLIGGLSGTLVMDFLNFWFWRRGKSEHLFGHLSGSMLMRAFRTNQRKNFVLGQVLHLITGAFFGLFQVETLKRYGKDNHLVKGGMTGLITWGLLYNFGQRMNFFSRRAHLTKTHYASLWENLVYGLVSSQVIVSLADPSIFAKYKRNKEKATQKDSIYQAYAQNDFNDYAEKDYSENENINQPQFRIPGNDQGTEFKQ